MRRKYPLATSTWDNREIEAATRVLTSGRTTMGAHCAAFEHAFADYVGTKHAVMVNSGSSANLLMVAALVYTGRLPRGSTIAVPAVSWSTTYAPLQQFGMRLVLVDVDESINIDPDIIPEWVDTVFAVNLLGNPCDYDAFPENMMILEDNCESLGARYKGARTGTFGLMASHSLFYSHHINTMEGGVITTDDDELWRCLLALRAHGWTRDLPGYVPGFEASFQFIVPGYSVRPTEVQGAIGLVQLEKLPAQIEARRANGAVYRRHIDHQIEIGESSWFGFAILDDDRDALIKDIEDDYEVRPIVAGNIVRHDLVRYFDIQSVVSRTHHEMAPFVTLPVLPSMLPHAQVVHDHGLFIGNNPEPAEFDIRRLASILEKRRAA